MSLLGAPQGRTLPLVSAQTKHPSESALAPVPAAKLDSPLAKFEDPPGIVTNLPDALLLSPPPMKDSTPDVTLRSPPPTTLLAPPGSTLFDIPLPMKA